jgi:hypothetical protein
MSSLYAKALAAAGGREQAEFFNDFCSELVGICGRAEGSQLWHIAEHLDASAAKMLKELADTREYHKAEYQKDTLRRDELRREIWAVEKELREKQERNND